MNDFQASENAFGLPESETISSKHDFYCLLFLDPLTMQSTTRTLSTTHVVRYRTVPKLILKIIISVFMKHSVIQIYRLISSDHHKTTPRTR